MSPQEMFCCFIPECLNTNASSPPKKFARVPSLPKVRQLWIKAGLRLKIKVPVVDRTPMYCCEDHFDLKNDASKQWLEADGLHNCDQFIKLKRSVVPHVFPSRKKPKIISKPSKNKPTSSLESENPHISNVVIKEELVDADDLEHQTQNQSSNIEPCDNSSENDAAESPRTKSKSNRRNCKISGRKHDQSQEEHRLHSSSGCSNDACDLKPTKNSEDEIDPENKFKDEDKVRKEEVDKAEHTSQKKIINTTKDEAGTSNPIKTEFSKLKEALITKSETEEIQHYDGNSLKRKTDDAESCHEELSKTQNGIKTKQTDGVKKKKRKVVKEILAWIPSNPGVIQTPNVMQPFIVVQTPPVNTGSESSPTLQLPNQLSTNGAPSVTSVPLAPGKETQFILTVPDKSSIMSSGGQPVMLAVPQGCSFSVDKLPSHADNSASGDTVKTEPSQILDSKPSPVASTSSTPMNSSSDRRTDLMMSFETPASDHNYNTKCLPDVTQPQNKKINKSKHNLPSEKAASATTPITVSVTKVAATPTASASQPTSTCSCCCSSSNVRKRSVVDTTDLFDGSDKLSVSLQTVVDEFSVMKKSLASLTKELQFFKAENKRLKNHNRVLQEAKNVTEEEETRKLELAADALKDIFTSNQIRLLLGPRNDKGRVKWTDKEMDTAHSLSRISIPAYKYLVNILKYPFPSLTTMRRYMDKVEREMEESLSENHFMADDYGIITPEDDALARAILDADSDEELERDEGAIREMKEKELRQSRIMNLDQNNEANNSCKNIKDVPILHRCFPLKNTVEKRIVKIESQMHNKVKEMPEKETIEFKKKQPVTSKQTVAVVRLSKDRPACLKNNGSAQKKKTTPFKFETARKIVQILRPPSHNAGLSDMTPIIREVRSLKSKSAELTLKNTESSLQKVCSISSRNDLKEITKLSCSDLPVDSYNGVVVKQECDNFKSELQQPVFIITNDGQDSVIDVHDQTDENALVINQENTNLNYQEINYEDAAMEQSENTEIIPEFVEQCGNDQPIFHVQVEPTQTDESTLYEEVIIHCDGDGTPMFSGNGIINLPFQEESSFL